MMEKPAIRLFSTYHSPCPYLPDEISRNAIVDCSDLDPKEIYHYLITKGFRRNSDIIYRPNCGSCQQCISTRIIAHKLTFSRSQKRCIKRNQDLEITINYDGFKSEYQTLYDLYLKSRHEETPLSSIEEFFYADWCQTFYIEFKLNNHLLAVAVVDELLDGLSAVYTMFDPQEGTQRSLGTYAILWQVQQAITINKPYVYLGYWIKQCTKMNYKTRFQPLEGYINYQWQAISP